MFDVLFFLLFVGALSAGVFVCGAAVYLILEPLLRRFK